MSDRVLCSCVVLFAALCLLALPSALPSRLGAAELQTLEIASKSGVHTFAVEMAVTPEEQSRGLMYRKSLPEGQGMLFDFQARAAAHILDEEHLHLARHDLHPQRRPHHADRREHEPLSERMVPSGGSARAVLEVIGGTARSYGIAPGDRVARPIFKGGK